VVDRERHQSESPGTLYVVAGPIGNLEDVTLRALRVLSVVSAVLAEDTRVTKRLLTRYQIATPVLPLHAHTSQEQIGRYVHQLLSGQHLALMTDAGTPGVSDPAAAMVQSAIDAGVMVSPVPGPSAVTAIVSIAAVPDGRFVFEGFVPRARADRRRLIERIRNETRAVVLYEAPHRLDQTLQDMAEALPGRRLTIGRELTKRFEEVFRGTVEDAVRWRAQSEPRGEYTLLVHAASPTSERASAACHTDLDRILRDGLQKGVPSKDLVWAAVQATGMPRRAVYTRLLTLRSQESGLSEP